MTEHASQPETAGEAAHGRDSAHSYDSVRSRDSTHLPAAAPAPAPRFEAFTLPPKPIDEAARRALLAEIPPVARELADAAVSITFLAGAGTRWRASLAEAKRRFEKARTGLSEAAGFSEDKPRGLFPVPDFLHGRNGTGRVAMAAYAFDAVRRIPWHIVVVRGWEKEIDEFALAPAGISPSTRVFFTQRGGPRGEVYGHGDAALQCEELWRNSHYVVTNFGGDANSALTVELALRAFAQFDTHGIEIGAIIPVARVDAPSYPVYLSEEGLPIGFWHHKLTGEAPRGRPAPLTNVGIRVYRADWLSHALREMEHKYRVLDGRGAFLWNIPGNDPAKHECALDNVDNYLANQGLVRVMSISLPRELTPLKELGEYREFVRATREVQTELSAVRL